MAEQNDEALWLKLDQLVWSCAISQAVHVAVELDIPELLEAAPRSAEELSAATSSDLATLESVLFALTAFEVLAMDEREYFSLTEMGTFLLKYKPGIPQEAGLFFETIYKPLGSLLHAVRTSERAFDHAFGTTFFEYLAQNPAVGRFFNEQMIRNAPGRYGALSSVYDFSNVKKVVDVGGGEGGLLLHLLAQQPHLTVILFDLPSVVANARQRFDREGLSGRCEIVGGNFLESIPRGGDLYVIASVMNNLRDADASLLLANCRAAMERDARLLILDNPRKFGDKPKKWRSLVTLGIATQRGAFRSRTEIRFRELLRAEGFELASIRPGLPQHTLIEAVPI